MKKFAQLRAKSASKPSPVPADAAPLDEHTPLTGPGKDAFVESYREKMAEVRATSPKLFDGSPVAARWATTFEGARAQALAAIEDAEANPPGPSTWPRKKSLVTLLCEAEGAVDTPQLPLLLEAPRAEADDFRAFDDVSALMPGLYAGDDAAPAAINPPDAAAPLGNLPPERKTTESLGLPAGIVKALARAGISSLAELLEAADADTAWTSIKGIGPAAAEQVAAAVHANRPAAPVAPPVPSAPAAPVVCEPLPPIIVVEGPASLPFADARVVVSSGWNVVDVKDIAPDAQGPVLLETLRLLTGGRPTVLLVPAIGPELQDLLSAIGGVAITVLDAGVGF